MRGYLIVSLVAALITAGLTPLAIGASNRFGILAQPDGERRLHKRPTPVLGGVAMCIGVIGALLVAWRIRQFHDIFASSSEVIGVGIGALIITAVGLADDLWEVSPPAKLAGQVLAGSAMYLFGVTLDQVTLPFIGNLQISADLTPLITVLWVIGMGQAINLIDGLDGLAAGIVAIASAAFLLYSSRLFDSELISGSNMGPLVAAITLGICVGFLPYNFSPARVFMGDAGALLLGLLMAASTVVVGGRAVQGVPVPGQTFFFLAPLFIPILILAVPIGDTVRLLITRTIRRTGFATADRDHLHYRLIELGHGPRRAVVLIWLFTVFLSAFALAPLFFKSAWVFAPLSGGLLVVSLTAFFHPDLIRQRREARRERA